MLLPSEAYKSAPLLRRCQKSGSGSSGVFKGDIAELERGNLTRCSVLDNF